MIQVNRPFRLSMIFVGTVDAELVGDLVLHELCRRTFGPIRFDELDQPIVGGADVVQFQAI